VPGFQEGKQMSWFWLNVPLMLVFFGLWAGVPLWYTLTRLRAELDAKNAQLAAAVIVVAPPTPTATAVDEAGHLAYAGAGDPR
jgi:hypothetical protein